MEQWHEWLYDVVQEFVPRKIEHRKELAPWVSSVSFYKTQESKTLQVENSISAQALLKKIKEKPNHQI